MYYDIEEKDKLTRIFRKYLLWFLIIPGIVALTLAGCGEADEPVDVDDDSSALSITGATIPSKVNLLTDASIIINGSGFKAGDQIQFSSWSNADDKYTVAVGSVTAQSVTVSVPKGIKWGNYTLTVIRGDEKLGLGSLEILSEVPDKAGMTIKGIVHSDQKGIPGVIVSDGFDLTVTDEKGIYYLKSQKEHGYVFVVLPGDYEAPCVGGIPQFFKQVSPGSLVEQRDFQLTKTDNTEHVVIVSSDWHLANRNNDVAQYRQGILADANATIASYEAAGKKVYGLTLGDLSWETYWYSTKFALPEYLKEMSRMNCPTFNTMGNHDNDPYFEGDWYAEETFKRVVGPTYYAFNIGDVHYIVLDNVEYINTGGRYASVGQRNYNTIIVPRQREWLRKYLATIEDKSKPLIIGMHVPLFNRPQVDANGNYNISIYLKEGDQLVADLAGFSNVHVLTGHSHFNWNMQATPNIMEHNIGAVSATWWWTGRNDYGGNHVCKDGSPGGYAVWEMNGTDVEWYYKSAGYERNYQFRAYDLNTVHITLEEHAPDTPANMVSEFTKYAYEYGRSNKNNEVLINVFGYDDDWEVVVKENGKSLDVRRVNTRDPLHLISYTIRRVNFGNTPSSSMMSSTTSHLFKAQATTATLPIEITVTDRFGNIYTETMERPKRFTYSMR